MYVKEFEIRWSDLDANRHVANSSYVDMLSETRMSFLREHGVTQQFFESHGIGPVIFSEEFFYISEIKANEKVSISLELLANSADGKYIKFAHCIFNAEKKLSVYSITFFGWFNLAERKLIEPPVEIKDLFDHMSKAEGYELMSEPVSLKNPKIPFGKTFA